MLKYKIEGNHPTFRYINWFADDIYDLKQKVDELKQNDYKVTVKTCNDIKTIGSIKEI